MKIEFLGAARCVTGSSYLIHLSDMKVLVDCGMFQGRRELEDRNYGPFPFDPTAIDYLIITHAHIDHLGLFPKLIKDGFKGKAFATRATVDLSPIMLMDTGHIQETEAQWKTKKALRTGKKPVEPVYTMADAELCKGYMEGVGYDEFITLSGEIRFRFRDAGHILGSASLELWGEEKGRIKKVVFSGDLGSKGHPIVKDPAHIEEADAVIIESTYGNRLHKGIKETEDELIAVIAETQNRGGNVLIPSFALGRTQDILYFLNKASRAGRLSNLTVYVDSPLAIAATEIYLMHPDCFDKEAYELIIKAKPNSNAPKLIFTETAEESMEINKRAKGAIIIAGSGMCEAGRIRHHLKHNLWKDEASIIFVGYQAEGTLGRRIVDGARMVRVFGEEIAVKARVYTIGGLSAHADRDELLDWLGRIKGNPDVFVVHSEEETSFKFADAIIDRFGYRVHVPKWREAFEV